jgi:PIN domain nuclease of toxin-antitoxin system
MLNVDTHILLFTLLGKLTPREMRFVKRESLGISAIVLWEIAKLHQKGRITLSLDDPELIAILNDIHVWPITREVCLKLAELDFASDPADEIIAATSLVHNIPLLTRDRRIRTSRKVLLA